MKFSPAWGWAVSEYMYGVRKLLKNSGNISIYDGRS